MNTVTGPAYDASTDDWWWRRIFGSLSRLVSLAILVTLAIVSFRYPVSIFGLPVYLTEIFAFAIFIHCRTSEIVVAVLTFFLLQSLLGTYGLLPMAFLFPLLIECLIVRGAIKLVRFKSVSDALIFAGLCALPLWAFVHMTSGSNVELGLFQVARKIFELFLCIALYQVLEKAAIFVNYKFGNKLPLFPSSLPLKDLAQAVFSTCLISIVVSLFVFQLSESQARIISNAKTEFSKLSAVHDRVIVERTTAVLARADLKYKVNVEAIKEYDGTAWDGDFPDIRLADWPLAAEDIVRWPADEYEALKQVSKRSTNRQYAILPPTPPETTSWRFVSVYGFDRLVRYSFRNKEALLAYFSSENIKISLVQGSLSDVDLGANPAVGSEQENPGSSVTKIIETQGITVWTNHPSVVNGVPLLRAYAPGSAFITFGIEPAQGSSEIFINSSIDAWPVFRSSYELFSLSVYLGFLIIVGATVASSLMIDYLLAPIRAYSDWVNQQADSPGISLEALSIQGPVKQSIVEEPVVIQQVVNNLLGNIARLSRGMQETIQMYDDLVASMPIGVMGVDRNNDVVSINEGLSEICQLDEDSLREISSYSSKMAFSRVNTSENLDVVSGDGTLRKLTVQKLPRVGPGAKLDGYWAVVIDLTGQKLKDAQLAQASKLATLGQMATGVAHELNQPLNVLAICQSRIAKETGSEQPDIAVIKEKAVRMKTAIDRASRIITHMRTYGRVNAQQLSPVDAREALRNAIDMMLPQLKVLGVELSQRTGSKSLQILGDEARLEQVILNLIGNSRDATVDNAEVPRIDVKAYSENGRVVIKLSDNGGGGPDEDLFKIFEPFYTTKEAGEGTGLGGSISAGIIKDMGGTINAANENDGLCVTILIPELGAELDVSRAARSTRDARMGS